MLALSLRCIEPPTLLLCHFQAKLEANVSANTHVPALAVPQSGVLGVRGKEIQRNPCPEPNMCVPRGCIGSLRSNTKQGVSISRWWVSEFP